MSAAVHPFVPVAGHRVLPALRCVAVTAPLLLLGPSGALSQSGAGAPPGAMRVTTDTPEYCDALAQKVQRAEQVHPSPATGVEELAEVNELAEEGHHMCVEGLIRGGLARLRRALMMLRADK